MNVNVRCSSVKDVFILSYILMHTVCKLYTVYTIMSTHINLYRKGYINIKLGHVITV